MSSRWVTLFFAAVSLCTSGCESAIGIKDYTLETCGAECQGCSSFCKTVYANCTLKNQVYKSEEQCRGVCAWLAPGDSTESSAETDTVACRADQANAAGMETEDEQAKACQNASPGGGTLCRTNASGDCSTYCTLLEHVCPRDVLPVNCEESCAGLRDDGPYNVERNYTGDTVQCRLVHLSAATVDPTTHCAHVNFFPFGSSDYPCLDHDEGNDARAPKCTDFCKLVTHVCSDEFAVYETQTQCEAVCSRFPAGLNVDATNNSVGCRRWHTYKASDSLATKRMHCPHAGPGGGPAGHCQDDSSLGECEPFCGLAANICPTAFAAAYGHASTAQKKCHAACATLQPSDPDANPYSVAAAQADPTSLWGRLLLLSQLAEVVANDPSGATDPSGCDDVVIQP